MINNGDLISIIVPIYNTEKYLRECLESIRNQTYKNFEAILVDDGSRDSSPEIVDEYCKLDSRFTAIHQENGGSHAARNSGLDVAQGKYVVFWDSDDTVPEDALEQLHETIATEEADFVVGGVKEFDIFKEVFPKGARYLGEKPSIEKFDRNFMYSLSACNKMFNREKIESEGLRFNDIKYLEDGDFLWRLIAHCDKIAGCNHVVYNVRLRSFDEEPSMTQIGSSFMFEHIARAIEMIRKTIESIPGDEDKKTALLDTMYYRYAGFNLVNLFYRIIWKSQKDFTDKLNYELGNAMRRMSEEKLGYLINSNPDIDFAKPLRNKEELAENPIFAIIITSKVDPACVNTMLANLYSQKFPAFRVMVAKSLEGAIDEVYKKRLNLQFFNDGYLGRLTLKKKISPAEFLIYSNNEVYWDADALLGAYKYMKEHPDCTLLKCKDKGKNTRLSNKIIRMDYVNETPLFLLSPGRYVKSIPEDKKSKCKSIVFTGSIEDLK